MVERILKFFHRGFNGLHAAAALLAVSALASQLLGLWRDRLFAAAFGAGRELDIYYAAFRLPDLIYAASAALVSAAVLIPLLLNHSTSQRQSRQELINNLFTVLIFGSLIVAGLCFWLLPYLAPWLAPGFDLGARAGLVTLSRILLWSPILLGLSNLLSAIVQSERRFFIYALSPLLYNLGIIAGVSWFYPRWGLAGLAWGVVLGALLHAGVQIPSVWRSGWRLRLTPRLDWPSVRTTIKLSLPRTLALSTNQLTLLILVAAASFLGSGSIAVFNFALNLQSVPLTIIGVSYSVAAFPLLAHLFNNGRRERFLGQVIAALRHILFWVWPVTILFIVLRAQIVRVILGSGRFDWADTRLVAAALALFVVSLAAQSLVLLLVRAYYAAGWTRRPLLINLGASAVTIMAAVALLGGLSRWWWVRQSLEASLRVAEVPATIVLVLPLAFSLGAIFNAVWLWHSFQRDFGRFPRVVNTAIGQSILASSVAGVVAYVSLNLLDNVFDLNKFWGIFGQGALAGLAGVAVFILILQRWDNQELRELSRSLSSKFWRTPTIAPEPEGL